MRAATTRTQLAAGGRLASLNCTQVGHSLRARGARRTRLDGLTLGVDCEGCRLDLCGEVWATRLVSHAKNSLKEFVAPNTPSHATEVDALEAGREARREADVDVVHGDKTPVRRGASGVSTLRESRR